MDPPDCAAVLRPVKQSVDWFAVRWARRAIRPEGVKTVGCQVNNGRSWNGDRCASTWCRLVNSRSVVGPYARLERTWGWALGWLKVAYCCWQLFVTDTRLLAFREQSRRSELLR